MPSTPTPTPLDAKLYAKVKAEADRIYLTHSAYKSGWIVKTYKERGGMYAPSPNESKHTNVKTTGLTRWFKEAWVDINRPLPSKNNNIKYATCGRKEATLRGTYPLCRHSKHINALSPKTPTEFTPQALAKAKKDKQRIKNKGNIRYVPS